MVFPHVQARPAAGSASCEFCFHKRRRAVRVRGAAADPGLQLTHSIHCGGEAAARVTKLGIFAEYCNELAEQYLAAHQHRWSSSPQQLLGKHLSGRELLCRYRCRVLRFLQAGPVLSHLQLARTAVDVNVSFPYLHLPAHFLAPQSDQAQICNVDTLPARRKEETVKKPAAEWRTVEPLLSSLERRRPLGAAAEETDWLCCASGRYGQPGRSWLTRGN